MGSGIAQALVAQGAHVVVNDFHQDRAESAARQLCEAGLKSFGPGGGPDGSPAILPWSSASRPRSVSSISLLHNAGIPAQGLGYTPFLQSPESEWNAWLQLNLHGLMRSQALLPAMQEQGWGRIVPSTPTQRARPMQAWGCVPMVRPRRQRLASSHNLGRSGPASG